MISSARGSKFKPSGMEPKLNFCEFFLFFFVFNYPDMVNMLESKCFTNMAFVEAVDND